MFAFFWVHALLRTLPGSGLDMRLSLVAGASVCITVKCVGGELLDLEPLDAKRLQAKNLHDYLQDIILAEKVDFVLANHEWLHGEQVARRCHKFAPTESNNSHNANASSHSNPPNTREIVSNVLHAGPVDMEHKITTPNASLLRQAKGHVFGCSSPTAVAATASSSSSSALAPPSFYLQYPCSSASATHQSKFYRKTPSKTK